MPIARASCTRSRIANRPPESVRRCGPAPCARRAACRRAPGPQAVDDHEVQSRFRIGLPDRFSLPNPLLRAIARATLEGTNLNFRLRANTGRLYSLRSGRDLNGDQSTRDRPPGVPRNSHVGPGNWNLDMTLTKDYFLGGAEGAGAGARDGGGRHGRRPEGPRLRLQAGVNNVLNRSQPRGYGSVVTSPLFGLPIGYTGGRTIDLSMSVDF